MGIAITKLFAQLLFRLYELLDNIFEIFGVLSGVDTLNVKEGGEKARSLLEIFLESDSVSKAFLLILIVGIAVAAVSIIFAIIKNIINMKGGERKSNFKIVGQGFGAVLTSMVMAVVLVTGIALSNTVLVQVYKATSLDPSASISAQLFDMSVGRTYEYEEVAEIRMIETYKGNEFVLEPVIENGEPVVDKVLKRKIENGNYVVQSGWRDGNGPDNLHFSVQTPDEVFGVHKKDLVGVFEDADKGYYADKQPMVEMDSFNFPMAYLTVIIILVAVIWSMLGLVKRIYDLVLLFIVLPLISGTIPLDDGARFKHWRDSVVSKIALAFGVVLSINIFVLIMPIINNINFGNWDGFKENLFKAFLLMGGALSINGGQILIARLMGSSAEESREMAQSARALAGGVMAAGSLARGAKNVVLGGYNKYGRKRQGIIPWGAEKTDSIASKYGGDGYQGSKRQKFLQWVGRVQPSSENRLAKALAPYLSGGSNGNNGASASPVGKGAERAKSAVSALAGNVSNSANAGANKAGANNKGSSIINNIGSAGASTVGVGGNATTAMNTAPKPNAPHAGLVGDMLNKGGKGGGYTKPKK